MVRGLQRGLWPQGKVGECGSGSVPQSSYRVTLRLVENMQALKSLLGLPLSFLSWFNAGNANWVAGKKISR